MPAVWQSKNETTVITRFRLDGKIVTVEQTITGYTAQVEGSEKKRISSTQYMGLVLNGQIC